MWRRNRKETAEEANPSASAAETGGNSEFEEAAARVTAAESSPSPDASAQPEGEQGESERFIIREEWAEGASRLLFLPPAKFIHPAFALDEEEAQIVGPKMQSFLQAVVDRYEYLIPGWTKRLSNKFPELTELLGVVAVLGYHKYKLVKRLRAEEAEARARAGEGARNVTPTPTAEEPARKYKTGERDAEGTLIV